MRSVFPILLTLASAACGGAASGTPETPAGPTCADAAANTRAKLSAEGRGEGAPDRYERLEEVVARSCTDDAWPAEVVQCVATAGDHEALQDCAQALPEDVLERLGEEISKFMEMPRHDDDDGDGDGDGDDDDGPVEPPATGD